MRYKRRGRGSKFHEAVRRLTDSEEYAILCRKPFNLPLAEFLRLDDWQIVNVYFRPPTADSAKHGYYWPMPASKTEADLDATMFVYFREGRRNGVDEKTIRRGWRRYKLVLLYGIEGEPTSHAGAMRRVMRNKGETPEAIEAAVAMRRQEMADALVKRKPRGFG